ncbi:MAG: pantoate--beta-alanine ligase [Planctomycetota bacterium]
MRVLTRIAEAVMAAAGAHDKGSLGFVPTMGALHEGHLSLVRQAADDNDMVAVSIFVNPLQFGAHEDLERYPRTPEADAALLESAGADMVFLLSADEMYPDGFATRVVQDASLTTVFEGAARPGHFEGVLTVVAKLFGIVGPCRAYFGRKDYQQTVVVRRMVADLNLPVNVIVGDTVRDADGLALSSRNAYLDEAQRAQGLALVAALTEAEARFEAGERDGAALAAAMRGILLDRIGAEPDYAVVVDPDSLAPRGPVRAGDVALVASPVGPTRLIDNHVLGATMGRFVAPFVARS